MAPTKTALIPISTKITDAFIILLGASLFGLSILEAYFYGGVFRSHSGLELSTVIGLILVAALLTRLTPLSPFIKRSTSLLLLYFLPVLAFIAIALDFADDIFYANFSFSTFHLHPVQLHYAVLYSTIFLLIYFNWDLMRAKLKQFIFGIPFVALSQIALVKHLYYSTWFHFLRREDSVFEYITAINFLIAGIIMIAIARRLWLHRHSFKWWKYAVPYSLLVGIILCGIAGEEISWGQRLLGIETPEFIAERNTQDEITLHNHELILPYVYHAYFAICLYGIIAGLAKTYFVPRLSAPNKKLKLTDFIAPDWYAIPYFFPTLYYTTYRFTLGWEYHGIGQWEEITEMFLAMAGLFFALSLRSKVFRLFPSPKPLSASAAN